MDLAAGADGLVSARRRPDRRDQRRQGARQLLRQKDAALHLWSWSQFGKKQWVRQDLPAPRTVVACEVYWFDETPANADCRVPQSWRLLYSDGEQWKEVTNASGYGLAVDGFNVVTFDPVKTLSMRLEVQCHPRRSAGIYEWRIRTKEQ